MNESNTVINKLNTAVKALREIRNMQGRVCEDFAECKHIACTSSYTSWAIADIALAVIEEINKYGCKIYKDLSELEVHRFYRKQLAKWIDQGKGIAVYSMLNYIEKAKAPSATKYCSFGTSSSTIPNCDVPPATMPKRGNYAGKARVYYLQGYIPKPRTKK